MSKSKKVTKQTKSMKAKKKVVAKKAKPVAKKKRVTIKDRILNMYKIVPKYSENLMQDVYSVVYRKKELKRFVNEALASNYIQQEVLLKLGEYNIQNAKQSRKLKAELAAEFE